MKELGEFVANENLSTIYKILLYIIKPDTFIKEMPTITSKYYSGVTVKVDEDLPARSGRVTIENLTFHYASLLATGWMELGMRKVGAREVKITEKSWQEGKNVSPILVFDISWE